MPEPLKEPMEVGEITCTCGAVCRRVAVPPSPRVPGAKTVVGFLCQSCDTNTKKATDG